jgi:hypothetical protein
VLGERDRFDIRALRGHAPFEPRARQAMRSRSVSIAYAASRTIA